MIFSAMFWSTVEAIRNSYSGIEYRGSQKDGNFYANASAGIIAGGFVASVTTPLDTIKTRIQSGMHLEGSIVNQIKLIYLREGLKSLFAGVYLRTIKSSLHGTTYLIFY